MRMQENGPRPQVNYWKRFWRVWGPFLINWGIGIAVSLAASMVFMVIYSMAHTEEVLAASGSSDEIVNIAYKIAEYMEPYTTQVEGVSALITIPIMVFLYMRDRKQEKFQGIAAKAKMPAMKYLLVVGIAGTLSIAMNNLILIGNLSSYSAGYEDTAEALYSAPLGVELLCLGLLAPIAEELVFRGLMYRRMREDTGFVLSVIYTACIFGLFHGNLVQVIYATVMGLMLAYVCEKYGTVLAPILGHATANIVSILATEFNWYDRILSNIMVAGTATVICAIIAAIIFQIMQQMGDASETSTGVFG